MISVNKLRVIFFLLTFIVTMCLRFSIAEKPSRKYFHLEKEYESETPNICLWNGTRHEEKEEIMSDGYCELRRCQIGKLNLHESYNGSFYLPIRYACAYISQQLPNDCVFVPRDDSLRSYPECCEMSLCQRNGTILISRTIHKPMDL